MRMSMIKENYYDKMMKMLRLCWFIGYVYYQSYFIYEEKKKKKKSEEIKGGISNYRKRKQTYQSKSFHCF